MRPLLVAAVGLAATVAHTGAAEVRPQTLYARAHTTIVAFAQDGRQVAFFTRSPRGCNTVHVLSLAYGTLEVLPRQSGARNVTCTWDVQSTPVELALAGTRALWTLHAQSPIPFDYLVGASVADPRERRFQEVAHTNRGSGLWLGGVAGDEDTLVYGVTSIDYVDEAGCLAGTGTCRLVIVGGGVYLVSGRQRPTLLPGTGPIGAVAVATSAGAVAYVRAARVGAHGNPVAGVSFPIEIVDAKTGAPIARIRPRGTPLALALTPQLVATLERTPLGLRVAWYDRTTGSAAGGGSVPVPAGTSPQLTASDRWIAYRVGRSIRAVEVATHRVRTLARAAARPIGLSLDGDRLAWAENVGDTARIRTLSLKP